MNNKKILEQNKKQEKKIQKLLILKKKHVTIDKKETEYEVNNTLVFPIRNWSSGNWTCVKITSVALSGVIGSRTKFGHRILYLCYSNWLYNTKRKVIIIRWKGRLKKQLKLIVNVIISRLVNKMKEC